MALGEVSHSIVESGMLDENSAEGEDIATGELIESGRSWSVVLRELTAERRLFPVREGKGNRGKQIQTQVGQKLVS